MSASNYPTEVLSTVGQEVYINNTLIEGAVSYSDLGADAEELDASGLCHEVSVKVPGRVDLQGWELTYNFNKTDWATIEGVRSSSSVAIKILYTDGGYDSATGKLASNYKLGASGNSINQAKAKFTLTSTDGFTYTAPTP